MSFFLRYHFINSKDDDKDLHKEVETAGVYEKESAEEALQKIHHETCCLTGIR